jgi:membrane fusion protein (multidrug efflux system)
VAERVAVALGSFVAAGTQVLSIAHPGPLHVSARFSAAEALGHLRVGQPARLSLPGFPWSQYGSLEARLASVGSEAKGGEIAVELELSGAAASRIPVQHGLAAVARVEVERVAPAVLVLRALGKLVEDEPRAGSGAGADEAAAR